MLLGLQGAPYSWLVTVSSGVYVLPRNVLSSSNYLDVTVYSCTRKLGHSLSCLIFMVLL